MSRERHGVDRVRRAQQGADSATATWFRSFVKVQLGSLAVLASTFVLAAPAHAVTAPATAQVSVIEQEARPGFVDDHTFLGNAATSRPGLPFAGPDLTMLVLGGLVVIAAAVGAPILLQPLRGIPPVLVAATTAPDPLLPVSAQGAAAHASA